MLQYDRKEERTGVQEIRDYDPRFDVQCDFVMVYGFHDLKKRVAHWKKHGYVVHLMTGVSIGFKARSRTIRSAILVAYRSSP